jgi:WD40 repeat protein
MGAVDRMQQGSSTSSEPYVGLRPYTESERALFFGRERDADLLVNKIVTNRLTLLYAPSGVGKTSLLRTMVIPALAHADADDTCVVYLDSWVDGEPYGAVLRGVRHVLRAEGQLSPVGLRLRDQLAEAIKGLGKSVILVLDQFEEFLQRHEHNVEPFRSELVRVVRSDIDVRVVISFREEFLAAVDSCFRDHLVGLFASTYHLEHLTPAQARTAVEEPAERFGKHYHPDLVDRLLTDLDSRRTVVPGRESAADNPFASALFHGGIEVPFLQLICRRLWQESQLGAPLTLSTYLALGERERIISDYVEEVMSVFSELEMLDTARLLGLLVPRSGLKVAYPLDVLVDQSRVAPHRALKVLDHLEQRKIVRTRQRGDEMTYELYHDAFIGILRPWRRKRLRRNRRRILYASASAIAIVALIAGGWGGWWLIGERNMQKAKDFALDAQRLLLVNPSLALARAREAYAIAPSSYVTDVLRTAYDQAATSAGSFQVEPEKGLFRATQVSSDDHHVFARSENGWAYLWPVDGRGLPHVFPASECIPGANLGGAVTDGLFDAGKALITAHHDGSIVRWPLIGSDTKALLGDPQILRQPSLPHAAGCALAAGTAVAPAYPRLAISADGSRLVALEPDSRGDLRIVVFDPAGRMRESKPVAKRGAYTAGMMELGAKGVLALQLGPDRVVLLDVHTLDSRELRLRSSAADAAEDEIVDFAFNLEGNRLAIASNVTLRTFDPDSGAFLYQVRGQDERTFRAIAMGRGDTIAAVTSVGEVLHYRREPDGRMRETFLSRRRALAVDVRFDPSGEFVAAVGRDKVIRIIDVGNQRTPAELRGHTSEVSAVWFGADSHLIVSADTAGNVRLWRSALEGREIGFSRLRGIPDAVILGRSPARLYVQLRELPHLVHVFGFAGGDAKLEGSLKSRGAMRQVSVSGDGKHVLAVGFQDQLYIWDVETAMVSRRDQDIPEYPDGGPRTPLIMPARTLLLASDTRPAPILTARLLDARADRMLTLHADGSMFRWRVHDREVIVELKWKVPIDNLHGATELLVEEQTGVIRTQEGQVFLVDITTGSAQRLDHDTAVSAVALSDDGKRLLTASGKDAVLWDVATRAEIVRRPHEHPVVQVAFDRSGMQLTLTESLENTLRVWLGDSDAPRSTIRVNRLVSRVAFVQAEKQMWIVAVAADRVMRYPCYVYCVPVEQLMPNDKALHAASGSR